MRALSKPSWILCAIAGLSGCSATQNPRADWAEVRPETVPSVAVLLDGTVEQPVAPSSLKLAQADASDVLTAERSRKIASPALDAGKLAGLPTRKLEAKANTFEVEPTTTIQTVTHVESVSNEPAQHLGTLTIDGRTYRVDIHEEVLEIAVAAASDDFRTTPLPKEMFTLAAGQTSDVPAFVPIATNSNAVPPALSGGVDSEVVESGIPMNAVAMDLGSALAAIGGGHPAVGRAQWRVQEAYARLDQAEVLWLPSIRAGMSLHRHDGNYQASNGGIVDVNRSSLQAGLGVGATGAGTTQRPGVVAEFHLADAIFQPKIAQDNAWAAGHGSNGVYNQQLLEGALAYLELLEAEQDKQILVESRQRTAELAQLTRDFAEAGEGLQADADRMQTELSLIESRLAEARERSDVASARLAHALSVSADQTIVPMDPVVTPIHLVAPEYDRSMLISTGLSNRPELKEAQALVAAACDEFKRQKYSPFVPSVLLGFSTGGFGGGLGNSINNVDDRFDFDAILSWEVRNLGFGERAARRRTTAQFQQAKFEKLRVLDQVAREVSEAHSQVTHRRERILIAERAIETAQNSFDRNLSRIRDGEGLPIEVLQSIRALEDARRTYLRAVAEHNDSQFQLQWALGWPVGE